MAPFKYGGMYTLGSWRKRNIFQQKTGKKCLLPHCPYAAYWLLQSPVSLWIFPCPHYLFSSLFICSRQPPRLFQRSGLHANCLSMAWSPPTYIMHLVSSTQSGLRRFSRTFKFWREADCKTLCLGLRWGKAEQPHSKKYLLPFLFY